MNPSTLLENSQGAMRIKRPTPLTVSPNAIPAPLKSRDTWVCWGYALDPTKKHGGQWTKRPYQARCPQQLARTNDPQTWSPFELALQAHQRAPQQLDGIGLVLTNDLVGIDLDHVYDEDGALETWAREIADRFAGTYIERSPSGQGLRVFCRGTPIRCGKGGPGNRVEVYASTSPRYMTVTGHALGDALIGVNEEQHALDWLHERWMQKTPAKQHGHRIVNGNGAHLTDEEVIAKCRAARNSGKFLTLWDGDGGGDHSADDLALCSLLAFYTQDEAQVDRLFRRSGLMRDKWDERHSSGGQTYGEMTLAKALQRNETYDPTRTGNGSDHSPQAKGAIGAKNRSSARSNQRRTRGEKGRIVGESERKAAIERASKTLRIDYGEPPPYPVDALGALAPACSAIAEGAQIAPAIVGQSLLAAAALLVQAQANIVTLAGEKPVSLYAITIADSGEGKTTADDTALRPIREWQQATVKVYQRELAAYEQKLASLTKGEVRPAAPRKPYRVVRDCTIEGLRREFAEGLPSQGVFSSEAAVMLGGYGMSAENRAKTAATFSSIWDDGLLSVSRQLAGRVELYYRRLSLHWLIQPDAARGALHDPLLSGIGFWPRFLCAWPAPSAPRTARRFNADGEAIEAYYQRCRELLAQPLGDECSGLKIIEADEEARRLIEQFFERTEQQAKTMNGVFGEVRPFAVRATEQVFRIAGVLACFAKKDSIDLETARGAMALVAYSLETWRAIFGDRDEAQSQADALALYAWLLKQPDHQATETAVLRIATPKRLRSRDRRDTALALLQQHQLVKNNKDAWAAILGVDEQ